MGYSVREACLLARSSLPQQRVLALRLLAAVLARCRLCVAASTANGGAGSVPLPPAVAAQLTEEGAASLSDAAALAAAASVELQWVAVWHHALHAADVALLLRRSLDDSYPAASAAAAHALAALLGALGLGAAAEAAAAEAAVACPLTGWPALPMRHLQV